MRYFIILKMSKATRKQLKAMSYKKCLKQLNNKYKPGEVIQVKYTNKKNHELLKYVKIKRVE